MLRKSQAAMEFLMTYGWAILIVSIVIGIIATSGIINYKSMIPSRCLGPTNLPCVRTPMVLTCDSGSKFSFEVSNPLPDSLTLENLSISGENKCNAITSSKVVINGIESDIDSATIRSGENFYFKVYCSSHLSNIVKQNFVLKYKSDNSYAKSAHFEIVAKPIESDCSEVLS